MRKIYYKGNQYIERSVPVNATLTPTANTISKFDLDAKMNSTDMTDDDVKEYMEDVAYSPMLVNDSVPIGAIQAFAGVNAPKNWLICDGSAVSRTTYAKLFSVIGTTYGEGDGATTFNLPDLKGRVLTGAGTLNDITYSVGDKKDAGLPNITGGAVTAHSSGVCFLNVVAENTGALYSSGNVTNNGLVAINGTFTGDNQLRIDASRSSSIYGNSTTVQPNATVANYIIKCNDKEVTGGALQDIQAYFWEDGTDNNHWHWRKWSDGKIEAWYYAGSVSLSGGVNDSLGPLPAAIQPFTTPICMHVYGVGNGFVADVHHFWIGAGSVCYVTGTTSGVFAVSLYVVFKN